MDVHQARRKSIQREQHEANFLKTRIESVGRQQEAAAHALELARRAKDDVDTELESLRQRYTAVTADLAQQRQCFDKTAAAAPFQLAAVCSRWREVALRQPTLWTYITSPRDGINEDNGYGERNTLVLERSGDRPLDIFLCWARRDWAACVAEEQLLFTLGTHARRWRSFELWLPDNCCKKEYLAPLEEALPLLQRLCFVAENSHLDISNRLPSVADLVSNCLPFAPELREVVLWGPNSFVPCPAITLPAVRTLRLHQFHLQQCGRLLLAVAPKLETLGLSLNCGDPYRLPNPYTLTFAHLRSLTLLIADDGFELRLINQMEFPVLDHLSLSSYWIEPSDWLRQFLEQIAPSVTKLTLTGPGATTADQLAVLSTLVNVQELHFGSLCPEVTSNYVVSETIFAEYKTWVQSALWPNLSSIIFSVNGKLELEEDGDNIIALVRWRTEDVDRDASSRVYRLQQFVFDASKTPKWLVQEVRRRLNVVP